MVRKNAGKLKYTKAHLALVKICYDWLILYMRLFFATGYLCFARQQVFSADSALQWKTVPGSGS